jgi:hypothetical protein
MNEGGEACWEYGWKLVEEREGDEDLGVEGRER